VGHPRDARHDALTSDTDILMVVFKTGLYLHELESKRMTLLDLPEGIESERGGRLNDGHCDGRNKEEDGHWPTRQKV